MSTEKTTSTKLEPRVAKLEVGLDRLTDDVRDLASVVRSQGSAMEQEIQKLVVAVTQASGPRKTDWGVIISAVGLILAIGSAVFWPLNKTSQDNKAAIEKYQEAMSEHMKLDNHPVGTALVKRLEDRMDKQDQKNLIDEERAKDELQLWRSKAMGLINDSKPSIHNRHYDSLNSAPKTSTLK